MAVNLSPYGGVGAQFLDNAGNVLTGGKIETYAAGTTTPQAVYTSSAGTTFHPNPIILDASGRVPSGGEIWLTDGLLYKFVLRDSANVLIATYDNIAGINSNFVNFSNQQEIQVATAGQTVFNLATTTYQPGTNSLSVFVDGVNQYGPGAQYAYLETNSTTITFTNGLHVGAEVKFTTSQLNSSGGTNANIVIYDPPFTNSVTTNVEDRLAEVVSVKDFGAVNDGVTDNSVAIRNAIDYVATIGGGTIYFPAGEYIVNSNPASPLNSCIDILASENNICLQGAGKYQTILKMGDNQDAWLLNINTVTTGASCNNIIVSDMTLDGNRDNQTATDPYCIRGGGDLSNVVFQNLNIKNACAYGIGLQHGTLTNIKFLNIDIDNTGEDGIDIKNRNNDNAGLIFDNLVISNFGDLPGEPGGANTGIDIRGIATLNNIYVHSYGVGQGFVGVRFQGDNPTNGDGGNYCRATNIVCNPGTNVDTFGLVNYGTGSSFVNCSVIGAFYGGYSIGQDALFANCEFSNCVTGVLGQYDAAPTRLTIDCCKINGGETGIRVRNGIYRISNTSIIDTTVVGLLAGPDSTNVSVLYCEIDPASGATYTAAGTGFVAFNSIGINEEFAFNVPIKAGRSSTQYIQLTGSGSGNFINGVSDPAAPKTLTVQSDANSSGLVLNTNNDSNVLLRRNGVTKAVLNADSISLSIPSSSAGLSSGDLYKDGGFVKIV